MAEITPAQLQILQHSLGRDQYGQRRRGGHPDGRNHFCAGPADEPSCRELVAMGFMVEHAKTTWLPYFNCSVTKEGEKAMLEASPKAPKQTPGQKRWQEYLDYSDANDCTFNEWLGLRKQDWYKDMKGRATR